MNTIIFDFDGTIADDFNQILEFLLAKTGRKISDFSLAEQQNLRHLSMKNLALQLGAPVWRLPGLYFSGRRAFMQHIHRVPVFAGMAEALADLHREGYQLFIISSNSQRNVNHFLSQHGLGGYFSGVYGDAGWWGKGTALKRVMRKNNLLSTSTVYVGDEARDVIGAHEAGAAAVAVNWGFSSEAELLKHSPTVIVRTPAELSKVLIDWGSTV